MKQKLLASYKLLKIQEEKLTKERAAVHLYSKTCYELVIFESLIYLRKKILTFF